MATPALATYAVGPGLPIRAGYYAGGLLAGNVALAAALAAGALGSNASQLGGALQLDPAVAAGTLVGYSPPAWLIAAVVGEWAQISGTSVPGALNDYCGLALRDEAGRVEALSLASGGHGGNLTNNAVYALRLEQDTPAWATLRAASDATGWDTTGDTTAYFADGKPVPRHSYWRNWWVPERSRHMTFGAPFVGSNTHTWFTRDAFNPSTNDWDAAGTYPDVPNGLFPCCRDPATGKLYATQGSLRSYDPTANTDANVGFTGVTTAQRWGTMVDTARNRLFHLSCGDSFSAGGAVNCLRLSFGGVGTAITFNASAAWTDFQANAANLWGHGCAYDKDLDRFYFYGGLSGQRQKVYVIIPNGTDTWDMTIMSVTGVTPNGQANGIWTKFFYSSVLKCLVLMVPGSNVYFLRTQ